MRCSFRAGDVWGATLATLAAGTVFFGAWAAVSQRLYPLPLRQGPLVVAVVLFVLLGVAAPQLDAAMPPGVLLTLAKAGVLMVFVATLGALGLLWPRTGRALATAG